MVQQIGPRTLSEKAYTAIRDSILRNDLLPNSPISVEELAQDLGISPTPVREALKQLQADGLVWSEAHKGIRVAELTETDICDAYEVRCALEPYIARISAAQISTTPQIRSRLEELKSRAENVKTLVDRAGVVGSSQFEAFTEVDLALNEVLLSSIDNQLMKSIFSRVSNHSVRIRSFVEASLKRTEHEAVSDMNAEHLEILTALLNGQADLVEQLVRNHLKLAEERTLVALRKSSQLENDESDEPE